MAIVLSGTTNDITVNGVSVATDAEVSSAVASGVAPKANTADLKEIGVGQTWQDVTASRALAVTYTNSTGKPIMVIVSTYGGVNNSINASINGSVAYMFADANVNTGSAFCSGSIIIPVAATYNITSVGSKHTWLELR